GGQGGQQQNAQGGGGRQGGQNGGRDGGAPYGANWAGGEAGVRPYGAGGDIRQYQREYDQRLRDIQDLRNLLGPNDPLARQLDQVANAMRIQARSSYPGDPEEIAKLAQQILDPMKGIELELSRRLQIMIGKDNVRSAQEDEMPAAWRKYIEDYYKRLA